MIAAERNGSRVDVQELKLRARGQWPEILCSVGGIDPAILDRKPHPCPKCGGRDRFRYIDDEAGCLFCNQCFKSQNGDGLAALQWLLDIDFPEVCKRVADHLRLSPPPSNGNGHRPKPVPTGRKFSSWQDAVADTESRMGPRSAEWFYPDAAGNVVGLICRWEQSSGKTIRPFAESADGGWVCGAMSEPRPLYKLPELLESTGPVWIFEGEGCVEEGKKLGLIGTTSSGGSNAAKHTDWSPVVGRQVIIWPDHDAAGQRYAADLLAIFKTLEPAPTVRLIDPAKLGLREAEDIVDWSAAHDAQTPEELAEELERIAEAAPVVLEPEPEPASLIVSIGDMVRDYPVLRPVVIDGLLRVGEVANLISKSKIGKSWLAYCLALSLVVGMRWLGRFLCQPGRVLIVDNELHPEVLAHRIPAVAEAMGLRPEEYRDRLDVLSLRGRLTPIDGLGRVLQAAGPGKYSVVIIDALYRMLPSGTSENDNAAMAGIYNQIDQLAASTGAAFVLIHHASKGSQSDKDVTDVGSGAGAQSRAADTHLVLRPHEDEGCVVLDAAVRSFAPIEPVGLRWQFPLWHADDEVDPERLKRVPSKNEQRQADKDAEGFDAIVKALRDAGPSTARQLRDATRISKDRIDRLVKTMHSDGRIEARDIQIRGNTTSEYVLADYLCKS